MPRALAVGIVATLVAVAACSNDHTPTSPSPGADAQRQTQSPTAAFPPTGTSTSGAVITGTITSGSAGSGTASVTSASTMLVQVVGTDISTVAHSNGAFALNGVPPGNIGIRITGGGIDASLGLGAVSAGVSVQLSIAVTGTTAVITRDSRVGEGQKRELEGPIESLQPGQNRFVLNSYTVQVTPGSTQIRHGSRSLSYNDLAVGARVHVRGVTSVSTTETIIMAEGIELQNDGAPGASTEIEGRVQAPFPVSGSCGSLPLVFNVAGKTVRAVASTSFAPGCQALAAGAEVEVKGTLEPDGSVLASKIDVEGESRELEGRVDTPFPSSGSCSAFPLVFKVGGKAVRAEASTTFKPACQALAAGMEVEVKGTLLSDGVLAASRISVDDAEVEISGAVTALTSGTCGGMNLTFTLTSRGGLATTVAASAATKFDGACSALVVGSRVEVTGVLRTDGSVLASKIDVESELQELEGRVDTPFPSSGSCSAFPLVFKVRGRAVRADASTTFKPACQALAAGMEVEVEGALQSDGALAASRISVDDATVEISGTVTALTSGTCGGMNLTFTLSSRGGLVTTIATSAATKFDAACSRLVAGAKVQVTGARRTDGSILATKIDFD